MVQAPREAFPTPVGHWKRLSEIETTPLWSGTVFRFSANWPYDDFVDLMLVSDQAMDGRVLRLLTVTGRKAGLMNTLVRFPSEAYVVDAVAICSDWLKSNWCQWVYDECGIDDVYVSKGYAAPTNAAGE